MADLYEQLTLPLHFDIMIANHSEEHSGEDSK